MPDTEHEEWLRARNKARGEHLKRKPAPHKKAEAEKKRSEDKNAWRYRGPLDTD